MSVEGVRYALSTYGYGGVPIKASDVAELLRYGDDDKSTDRLTDYSMAAVVRLADGRFAAVEGGFGCETGWSCQASLSATIHLTEQEAWFNVTRDGRALILRAEATS